LRIQLHHSKGDPIDHPNANITPYPQESLLIEALSDMPRGRLICTSPGLAQFAGAAAAAEPHSEVTCTYLDQYRAGLALDYWRDKPGNLEIECAADLPDIEAAVAAFPFSAGGEAELTRDLLQAGHQRLAIGGKLYATSDNRNDMWLGVQLRKLFRKLERRAAAAGVLYVGTKTEPLRKVKNYGCEFAFRDRGRLIRAFSRPGVFSHRHIDPGARHLIETMEVEPRARILDIGCGAGTVALAAACRSNSAHVHAVDSNARAVQCTIQGAVLNELSNITTELNAAGNFAHAVQYDLALANPPYYSGFRIARHFLTAARAALRPVGRILVVTKHPAWYAQNMPEWYDAVAMTERKGYTLFHGVRPPR
jgi:16S rRNA (guanine1207-N2)-methyltransferase